MTSAPLHFGGHGIQVDGANYLIPVDANIPDERRVRSRALDASGTRTNIVILDASRSTNSRGLAIVGQQPPDSIIVYSAAAGSNSIDSVAWYDINYGKQTHPVGGKQSNELELYDMSGNVWEWCWDSFGLYSTQSR